MFQLLDKVVETLGIKKFKSQSYIYIDELSKRKQYSLPNKLQRSPKIADHRDNEYSSEAYSELKQPLVPEADDDQRKCNINDNTNSTNRGNYVRVKVLMTKKEAANLLSKCKEEGTLEFKDVVNQLVRLPAQRINVVYVTSTRQDMELAVIPEEDDDFITSTS